MTQQYPNVPDAPGVPNVARSGASSSSGTVPQTSDGITVVATAKNQWGIYTAANVLAVHPDTIMSFGYDAEYKVVDYPLQRGSFASYDKVALSFETRVVMTKGGTLADRKQFLSVIDNLRGDTNLYNVVTPEWTYFNVNFSRVSINRERDRGNGLIIVELALREIREPVSLPNSAVASSNAAATQSNGTIQPAAVTPAQAAAAAAASRATLINGIKSAGFYNPATQVLSQIPLVAGIASQSTSIPLGNAGVAALTLSQHLTGLYADISLNGTSIRATALCTNGLGILHQSYGGFPGDLAFVDLQGSSDPDYTGVGARFSLLWSR